MPSSDDGHHVLVRQQQDGLFSRVAALPGVKQSVLIYDLLIQRGMDQWEGRGQVFTEAGKLLKIDLRLIEAGDGRALYSPRQAPCRCIYIDGVYGFRVNM